MLLAESCGKPTTDPLENEGPIDPNKPIQVTDFKPKEGGLGTCVVITGSNFGNDTAHIDVYFNEKKALLLKVRPNIIYAMVPKQPGDLSKVKVVSKNVSGPTEATLEDVMFEYHIRASVTTVAGVFNVSGVKDGPALEANFSRPSHIAVSDDGNIFISDDNAGRIAALSLTDNRVFTISNDFDYPWQSAFSVDQSVVFVTERRQGARPQLFKALYRANNWLEPVPYYDQLNDFGSNIIGSELITGLTADDEFVYVITQGAQKLARIHQESGKVELIGERLNLPNWNYLAYNKNDGYIYVAAEDWGRIYRFDPRNSTDASQPPSITNEDLDHIIGTGNGDAIEGVGVNAQLGGVSSITCDGEGNVYTCDYSNHVVWKIEPQERRASIIAGVPGVKGYRDGEPKESLFNSPYGVCATTDGILYVADTFNRVVRCIAIQ